MTRTRNPVTEAYNEQERLRLQREAAENPSANAEGEEQIDETAQPAFSDEMSVAAGRPGGSWAELADQQRADAETAQINANRQAFDQYVAIEDGAKQQKLALDHQRAIAGAAMIQSAFRNGGMSDRSLSAAFSQAFGRPIYGGQLVKGVDIGNGPETVFAMYGAAKDPQTGKATVAPVAMMGSREMLQIMKRAGLGDATNDLQNDIIDNSYLGKLTDDQRAAMGVSRPSAPISTGTTVISGAAMRRLRGIPRQPGAVSHFAADGRGGFSQSYHNFRTGENWSGDYGTRDPARRAAKWKVLESHADYTRYENDLTGEVVKVPKGETLQNVLRGTSEKEKVAQIQAQGRVNAARVSAELKRMGYDIDVAKLEESRRHNQAMEKNAADRTAGRGAGSGTAGGGKYDDKIAERLQQRADNLREKYGDNPTPEQQKEIDAAQANADAYIDRHSGSGTDGDGGKGTQGGEGMTPQQRAQAILVARRQKGGGADYGLRNDGKTYKGTGWLGELRLPDGGVATEYTMQSDAVRDANGNRIDFPTLVPTLTKAEQDLMVNDIIPNRKPVPDEIAQKAVDFARMRLANGQSVFANDGQPPAQGEGRTATATAARQPEVAATSESVRDEIIGGKEPSATTEKPTAQTQGNDKPVQSGGAVLSAEDERFLDETLKELEAPEEPDVSVSIPSDSPDYERRVRHAEAIRKREELPDWVKKLSPEEQTRYKAARTAKRGIEAITKEMGERQGASSASTADSYAAMLDALGPNGALRKKLSRLLSIIDKVGGNMDSTDF